MDISLLSSFHFLGIEHSELSMVILRKYEKKVSPNKKTA